jgi:hypothetical protein
MKRGVALQTILVLLLAGPANIFADGGAAVDRLPPVLSLLQKV